MSERTTIGGTVYEAIGSSSSNLLLKCNGTARIQWGNKLIDLIKNGKIASEGSQELIFIVDDESKIKSDGIYILTTEESDQLWAYKDGNKYNFTGTDLYISASKLLNLTVELKKQALDNIGMYYNTLEDVKKAGIKTGIVYVIDTKTLYTVKDGIIEEFEAKLKTITVDEETDGVELINSSVKIVLSILDEEYLILADLRITANYSIHVKNSALIGSESADKTQGYRLYIEGDTSYLDVDEINVRNGIKVTQYTSITFEEFTVLVNTESLEPHWWYLITDYQNPWKLPIYNEKLNRPILVRALDNKTLYKKGYLFKNHNIEIEYDPTYKIEINQEKTTDGLTTTEVITSRGLITWMKDKSNNNLANFDFLDYYDLNGNELSTLHYPTDDTELDKSVFPKYSHDNTLIVYDLKGTVIKDKVIDNTNVTIVDFKFDDSSDSTMVMYNNYLECRGLILSINCTQFYDNILKNAIKIEIENDFYKNEFLTIYSALDGSNINTPFDSIPDNNLYTSTIFSSLIENVKCEEFRHSSLQSTAVNCVFGNIENSIFTKELEKVNIDLIKSTTSSYLYSFNTIKNSTIKEITNGSLFYGEIIDSTIGIVDSEVTIHSNINKSTINKISNNVTLLGEINNSYIDVISDNTSLQTNLIESCNIKSIKNSTLSGKLENSTFENVDSTTIDNSISNSIFLDLYNCTLLASFDNVKFKTLSGCVFDYGTIENVVSFYNLDTITFNRTAHALLYNISKRKEIYVNDGIVLVVCIPDSIFYRGMIIMHSGLEKIPLGWAVCDGGTYEFEGVTSTTPNLINRFIKAVATAEEVKETLNENLNLQNEFTLKEENLPKHSHPHKAHTHEHTEITGSISDSGNLSVSGTGYAYNYTMEAVQSVSGPEDVPITSSKGASGEYYESTTYTYTGGNHTHDLNIYGGQIQEATSVEDDKTWENKPFKLEPNYYSLIFIMKL